MIMAESAASRPSRCRGRSAGLNTTDTAKGKLLQGGRGRSRGREMRSKPAGQHDRRAIGVPVSLGMSVPAVVAGAGQGWCWWCWVTPRMPDRLGACPANDPSPVLPAPAWPPSLA